jgi:glycosyltransferase involved in cell wall biosynthesis
MPAPPKLLFICHNHPDLHPGGTEIFSHGLFRQLRSAHDLDALYVACAGRVHRSRLPGTMLQAIGRAADEMLLWTGHFDPFMLSQIDLHGVLPELERLLRSFRPEVVHFHHALLVGVEAFQLVRRTLPDAAIVLTLHDYYPICANDGQLVTTRDRQLCSTPSPDACGRCFPAIARDRFVLRELFLKQALSMVDRFVSPSEFLKQRYVEWGIEPTRITVVRNGLRPSAAPPPRAASPGAPRNRFAFFGHLSPFKGALVAIEAARKVIERGGGPLSLALHGSADFQTDAFKSELTQALAGAPFAVSRGRYRRDEMASLIAEADWIVVPSIWWENAPLVIQEAFQHRRPVICSGIGGMAEAVRDGVDGLWFRPGDAEHLADRLQQALDPLLWERLANGITPPRGIEHSAAEHLALYQRLLGDRSPAPAERPARRKRQAGARQQSASGGITA